MTEISVSKDFERLTLSVTADYDVSAERAWLLWADPRQWERWWGPPSYPATVEEHEFVPGGKVSYYLTGPEGDKHRGWWKVLEVDAPRRFVVEDGFADESGQPLPDMPVMRMTVEITDRPGGITMTATSVYGSLESMQQVIEMGVEQGIKQAMGQIDAILAE